MTEHLKPIEWAKKIFWVAFVMATLSFACPLAEKKTGFGLYMEVFRDVFYRSSNFKMMFISFLLICTLCWLPIMAYAFRRYTFQKRRYTINQRLINYFLFAIGFSVYALPAYAYYDNANIFKVFGWGYWLLMFCMTVMFICYLIVQKEQLIDDDDFSKHLINND